MAPTRNPSTQILPGVHFFDTYANTFLLTDQRLVLIDTGSEASAKALFAGLDQAGVKASDLTSIVCTHTHGDHVTGLAALKERAPQARVVASDVEAPFISQERQYPGPPRPMTHRGVAVDVRLRDGQKHDGLTMVFTPGHTTGSMSLLDPAHRLLIAGDAVRTEDGVAPMEDKFNSDPRQHRESIKRLATLDFDALVCGHGPPIASGALAQVQALARKL